MEERIINFNNEENQEVETMFVEERRFNINKDFATGAAVGAVVVGTVGFGLLFAEKRKRKNLYKTTEQALGIIEAALKGEDTYTIREAGKFRKAEEREVANLTINSPEAVMKAIRTELYNGKTKLKKKEREEWVKLYERLVGIVSKVNGKEVDLQQVKSEEIPVEK